LFCKIFHHKIKPSSLPDNKKPFLFLFHDNPYPYFVWPVNLIYGLILFPSGLEG